MATAHPLPIQWNLAGYLERQRVTPHALMKATGLSPNTIYPIVRGEAKAVNLETLGVIAAGIEALTGRRPEISDLFEIASPKPPGAKLAALLKNAKPPLNAARLLGPSDWTTDELEASQRAESELRAEQRTLRAQGRKRDAALLELFLEPSSDETEA